MLNKAVANYIEKINSGEVTEISLQCLNLKDSDAVALFDAILNNPTAAAKIKKIYLSGNQLTSLVIPKELTALKTLHLSYNQLTSLAIPKELTSLTELYLSYNQLTSLAIPKELTTLTELYFRHNKLTSLIIPKELTSLRELSLSYNQLTSLAIPKELTSLRELGLNYNQLTSLVMPKELTALKWLFLDNNQLTSLLIPKELTALTNLYLDNNQLTSLLIPKELTALTELSLGENKLTSLVIPKETALRNMSLDNNQLSKFSKLMLLALRRINFKVDIQGMEINNIAPLSAEDITTNFKGQEVTFADTLMKLSLNNILLQQIKDWYWLLLNDKTMPKEMLELICKYCSIFLSLECAKNDIELQMQSAIELFSSIEGNEQFVNTLNTLVNFSESESFKDLITQRDEYIESFTTDKTDFTNRFFDILISYIDFPLNNNEGRSASQKFYADLQQLLEDFKLPKDLLKPKEVVEAIKLFRLNACAQSKPKPKPERLENRI